MLPTDLATTRRQRLWDNHQRLAPLRSVREVAAEFNRRHDASLSPAKVSNIERSALRKLRDALKEFA